MCRPEAKEKGYKMNEEESLKAYLEEEIGKINRRLDRIEREVSGLPKFLDRFTKAMERNSASFVKGMDKMVDGIRVLEKDQKSRAKMVIKHFKEVTKGLKTWNANIVKQTKMWNAHLKKHTKMLSDTLKKLEEMAKEEEYEE